MQSEDYAPRRDNCLPLHSLLILILTLILLNPPGARVLVRGVCERKLLETCKCVGRFPDFHLYIESRILQTRAQSKRISCKPILRGKSNSKEEINIFAEKFSAARLKNEIKT